MFDESIMRIATVLPCALAALLEAPVVGREKIAWLAIDNYR